MSSVSLVIPTYNRPSELRQLLIFLLRSDGQLPIIVLDSSPVAAKAINQEFCGQHDQIQYIAFDSDIVFYKKLLEGIVSSVKTDAVCLCADDDIVFPSALRRAAEILETDRSVAVAHGYYAHFRPGKSARITFLGYSSDVTESSTFRRIAKRFLNYEATLYGVHRTSVMRTILAEASAAPNLFTAEILSTALALGYGNERRLPIFSNLRSNAPSLAARHWHPAELLAENPAILVEGISYVRNRLTALFPADEGAIKLFDHAALAYVAEYVNSGAARRIAAKALEGANCETLREFGWHEFVATPQSNSWRVALHGSAPARWLKRRLAKHPALKRTVRRLLILSSGGDIKRNVKVPGDTAVGYAYLEPGFYKRLSSISLNADHPLVGNLAKELLAYNRAICD